MSLIENRGVVSDALLSDFELPASPKIGPFRGTRPISEEIGYALRAVARCSNDLTVRLTTP